MTTQSTCLKFPPSYPIQEIGASGGYFYYLASCCEEPTEHWGVTVSATKLSPSELGCPLGPTAPPPGPKIPETITPPPNWLLSGGITLCGYYNIGNGKAASTAEWAPAQGIAKLNETIKDVKFTSPEPGLQQFLQDRLFRLSSITVNYSSQKTNTTVTLSFWLAECQERPVKSSVNRTIEANGTPSREWQFINPPSPTVIVPAGRLLRLTATTGLEKDQVFHVVNDVS
jgi:hypothetical protein